jgi:hypothetical protein
MIWIPGINTLALGLAAAAGAAVSTAQAATTMEAHRLYENMKSDAFSRVRPLFF